MSGAKRNSSSGTGVQTPNPRRWLILGVGVAAQAASSTFQFGMPFLLPQLQEVAGGSLTQAGLLVACPSIGLMLTLILWGWVADAWGERLTMSVGLTTAGLLIGAILFTRGPIALGTLLVLAGAAAASVNAASGRVIMAWFGSQERGLAMGIRQTAQPVGVALAAITLPVIAPYHGMAIALLVPAGICLAVAVVVLLLVADPPETPGGTGAVARSPYRHAPIWQIHGASALLIVPQFTISAFAYLYLVDDQGLAPAVAGAVLGATQLLGAAARLAAGRWSDVIGSRLAPIRMLAVANAVVIAALTIAVLTGTWLAIPLLVAAAVITVSGNGLAFTAVAEIAGRAWSGRALGAQNTIQNAVASATPAVIGAVITTTSFAGGFAAAIMFPLLAGLALSVSADPICNSTGASRALARTFRVPDPPHERDRPEINP